MKISYWITLFASGLALIVFLVTLLIAESSPQLAAGAAMAIAIAIIPYVFSRSVEMIVGSPSDVTDLLSTVGNELRTQTELLTRIEALALGDVEAETEVNESEATEEDTGPTEWEYKGETITKRGHDYYIGDEPQNYATQSGARASIDARRISGRRLRKIGKGSRQQSR